MWNNAISDILIRLTKIESKLSEKGLNTLTVLENQNKCLYKFNERIEGLERYIYSAGDVSAIQGQLDNLDKNLRYNFHEQERLEKRIECLERYVFSVCDILVMQKQIDNHEDILNNNRNAAIEFKKYLDSHS